MGLGCERVQDVVGRRHAIQALVRDVVLNLRAGEWH